MLQEVERHCLPIYYRGQIRSQGVGLSPCPLLSAEPATVFSGLHKYKSLLRIKLLHSKFKEGRECSLAIITSNHRSQVLDLPTWSMAPVPMGLAQPPSSSHTLFPWPESTNPWTHISLNPTQGQLLAMFGLCPTSMVIPYLANNRFGFLFLMLSASLFNTINCSSSS